MRCCELAENVRDDSAGFAQSLSHGFRRASSLRRARSRLCQPTGLAFTTATALRLPFTQLDIFDTIRLPYQREPYGKHAKNEEVDL